MWIYIISSDCGRPLELLTKTIIMIKNRFMAGLMSLLVGLFAISCTEEEPITNFQFEVYAEDGSAIEGTQTVEFSKTKTFTFKASGLKTLNVDTPEGWDSDVKISAKKIVISAPKAEDQTAETAGTVTLTATPINGEAKVVTFNVAAAEGSVAFAVAGVSEGVNFRYAESQTFAIESANVAEVEVTAPKGWTVAANVAANQLTVTAPERTAADAALEGTVSLLPKSVRGTAGTAVSFNVAVVVTAPSLSFNMTEIHDVDFGAQTTIQATEAVNVANIVVKSVPAGWDVALNLATASAVITAPAFDATNIEGEGEIVITAVSASQDELDYTLPVSLVGINSEADFLAFAAAVNAATDEAPADLTGYVYNGEVVVNSSLDLSEQPQALFVEAIFKGVFNGKNNTITLAIDTNAEFSSIFKRVEAPGAIKNLKVAGSITNSGHNVKIAGVSCYSKGATFENIYSSVVLKQTGLGPQAGEASDTGGLFGGIVGDEQGNGTYRNCHNTGAMTFNSSRYVGGIIGSIWDKTQGVMEDCSNTGSLTFPNEKCNSDKLQCGGIAGATIGSYWQFKRCFNTGDISFAGAYVIRGLGGVTGTGFGNYEDCYNTGNIINTLGDKAPCKSRKIGGFTGQTWEDCGFVGNFKNCYNTGKVVDNGNYVGGFVGLSEEGEILDDGTALYHTYENCYNSGDVISYSTAGIADGFGGFAGTMYNVNVLTGCKNSGKVVGVTYRAAGGLIGRAADYIQIINCENSGDVYVAAVESNRKHSYSPVVGGICGVQGNGSENNIVNSKNTGKVTAMVPFAECVSSTYACEAVANKLFDPESTAVDKNKCDEATIKASAGAVVTAILPAQWTTTLPEGWL